MKTHAYAHYLKTEKLIFSFIYNFIHSYSFFFIFFVVAISNNDDDLELTLDNS